MLLYFFLIFLKAETQADVIGIILGNWTVNVRHFSAKNDDSSLPYDEDNIHFRSTEIKVGSILAAALYNNREISKPICSYNLTFSSTSKGKFVVSNKTGTIGSFDFSPILPPHISSVGDWGKDKSFNAVFITNKIAQLTLFEKDSQEWTVYSFDKEESLEPVSFIDKYFQYIFYAIVFFLCWFVSSRVQQWQTNKKKAEAERILAEQESLKKKKNK